MIENLLLSYHFLKVKMVNLEMAKPTVTDVRKEIEKFGNYRSHIKYYKVTPKYHKLVPAEVIINLLSQLLKMMRT
jgi:hypothetical protein